MRKPNKTSNAALMRKALQEHQKEEVEEEEYLLSYGVGDDKWDWYEDYLDDAFDY